MAKKDLVDTMDADVPAIIDDGQFAIMKTNVDELKMTLQETLGGEKLSVNDLPRVTVPGSGGTQWTVPSPMGDKVTSEIVGIIPFTSLVRAYWVDSFEETGGGVPPQCVSYDGLEGHGDPGGDCLVCPKAQFGSAKGGDGRGKACQESRLIFLVQQEEMLPIIIKAPATSLKAVKQYMTGMISRRKMLHSVYTKLTLERDKNQDGISFSKIKCEMVGEVEDPKITAKYAEAIKPYLMSVAKDAVQDKRTVEDDAY